MSKTVLIKTTILAIIFVFLLGAFTISLMMSADEPQVVLVYTQKEPIPNIAFQISSIPLALASYLKFGAVKFSALPATTQNIETALAKTEFLVIGTHGWDGMIYSDDKDMIGPKENPNLKMRSIYFGSCYFGTKRKDWESMFPNAKVIGHDDETYQLTGWFYLVFKSWIDLLNTNS